MKLNKFNIKRWKEIGAAFSVLLCFFLFMKIFDFFPVSQNNAGDYYNTNFTAFGINIPKNLNFAGDKVPQTDFSIRESLEQEFWTNVYWKSNAYSMFKRANRWFPLIESILKKNGVPDDFKYVALIESHLTNSTSPQNAVGFWQLIEATARNYGLEIDDEIDERYNIEKSTQAACLYFKEAFHRFNNWTLAAASYNLGMGGIESNMKKQNAKNYYDLLLNKETGHYIFRLLAYKTIFSDSKKFGFYLSKSDQYNRIPFNRIKIDSSINNIEVFAEKMGYSVSVLKTFNPWIRKNTLTNPDHKSYIILLPKKGFTLSNFTEYSADVLRENNFMKDSVSAIADTLKSSNNTLVKHKVAKSETIEQIAEFYEVSAKDIRVWNKFEPSKQPEEGVELLIYLPLK